MSGFLAVLLAVVMLAPAGHLATECRCAPAAEAAPCDCCPPAEEGCDACPLCLTSDTGDHAPEAVLADAGEVRPPRSFSGAEGVPERPVAPAALAADPRAPERCCLIRHVPRHVASTILQI